MCNRIPIRDVLLYPEKEKYRNYCRKESHVAIKQALILLLSLLTRPGGNILYKIGHLSILTTRRHSSAGPAMYIANTEATKLAVLVGPTVQVFPFHDQELAFYPLVDSEGKPLHTLSKCVK